MSAPNPGQNRMNHDLNKLIKSRYKVTMLGGVNEFTVKFKGPQGTAYEGGVWNVRVQLPHSYPFKSPSIGFVNKIFHPNIDEASGSICLDVINQKWSAIYDLFNVFETFLPQLLRYPNATDPLNQEAALLFVQQPQEYDRKVISYVKKYATEQVIEPMETDGNDSESSMSDNAEDMQE